MTHQVRPYPFMILAYAAEMLCLLRLARRRAQEQTLRGSVLAAYLLLLEVLLWLHNLGPLYAGALTLALLASVELRRLDRADWLALAGGHLLVLLCYLPGLAILRDQAPTWVSHTWLSFHLDQGFFDHLTGLYAAPDWPGFVIFPLLGMAIVRLMHRGPAGRLLSALLILALVPVALAVTLSLTVSPVFITRTMTPVTVPTTMLFALGATAWDGTMALAGTGGVLILGASMAAADVQARLAGPMQDWYRTVDWLAARFSPGDQVFAYPNEGALPLSYALRDRRLHYPIRPIPTAVPSFDVPGGWYPTGSRGVVSLPPRQLRAITDQPQTRAVPTIWLLRLGAARYDPGDVFLHELQRDRYVVRSLQDGPIDFIGLRLRSLPAPDGNRR